MEAIEKRKNCIPGLDGEWDPSQKGEKLDYRKKCRDPGSNWGPLELQSNALPAELSRLFGGLGNHNKIFD